jgi:hypothetical protein
MVRDSYTTLFKRVFKLDMGTVLLIYKPAVIAQKLQNFPYRHDMTIRIIYTYVKRFFTENKIFLRGYLLPFLAGLVGGAVSGLALAGRPLPGTVFIASKSSSVYKASCEKGFRLALSRRRLTVSFGNLSFTAISEIVIPSIPHIIDILRKKIKIVYMEEHLLHTCIVKTRKKLKMFMKNDILS